MLRDGFHQHAVHTGVAPYRPNSLDGGCPFHAGDGDRPFVEVPALVRESAKMRAQAGRSTTTSRRPGCSTAPCAPVEKDHIKAAYAFELAKCYEQAVRERQLLCLANIDEDLCASVAASLGLPAPAPTLELHEVEASPALSQVGTPYPANGRKVGIVVDASTDPAAVAAVVAGVEAFCLLPFVVAPVGGRWLTSSWRAPSRRLARSSSTPSSSSPRLPVPTRSRAWTPEPG